jgi:hypothetical protein
MAKDAAGWITSWSTTDSNFARLKTGGLLVVVPPMLQYTLNRGSTVH